MLTILSCDLLALADTPQSIVIAVKVDFANVLEFLIALSGSFTVTLDNGQSKKSFLLNKPNKGLLLPTGIWRELEDFSSGAICLVLSSGEFEEDDYIRDYRSFKNLE